MTNLSRHFRSGDAAQLMADQWYREGGRSPMQGIQANYDADVKLARDRLDKVKKAGNAATSKVVVPTLHPHWIDTETGPVRTYINPNSVGTADINEKSD